ncbi:hypothetical protein FLM48_19985 [Shewanella sp. Scap07]|uniref:hypothetical protein n=1 Tax=Shewanella sp. Scap07 TaxID=2589987 RepID=UPI0015BF3522|nr:hypothetical protein [Shewanella sp. Scap07]QLE87153.1 hypothetical protein FLM48_19985 [Shewanella sp. Scap07]
MKSVLVIILSSTIAFSSSILAGEYVETYDSFVDRTYSLEQIGEEIKRVYEKSEIDMQGSELVSKMRFKKIYEDPRAIFYLSQTHPEHRYNHVAGFSIGERPHIKQQQFQMGNLISMMQFAATDDVYDRLRLELKNQGVEWRGDHSRESGLYTPTVKVVGVGFIKGINDSKHRVMYLVQEIRVHSINDSHIVYYETAAPVSLNVFCSDDRVYQSYTYKRVCTHKGY